jgi:hypothetical protein
MAENPERINHYVHWNEPGAQQKEQELLTRWASEIRSNPIADHGKLIAASDNLRVIASDLDFKRIPDYTANRLAMDAVCIAIRAGAFSGDEWQMWRMRLADLPSFLNACVFISQYKPPKLGCSIPEVFPMSARARLMAEEIEKFAKQIKPPEPHPPEPASGTTTITLQPLEVINEGRSSNQGNASSQQQLVEFPSLLSRRQQDILVVLQELEAFDSDSRQSTEEIARRVTGKRNADPGPFKEPIAELHKKGLVDSKEGRGGGVWLTPAGKIRSEHLRKRL